MRGSNFLFSFSEMKTVGMMLSKRAKQYRGTLSAESFVAQPQAFCAITLCFQEKYGGHCGEL